MKKLFYLMMAFAATLFTACSDDDKNDTPINGVKIPTFENPVIPGQTVTIKGEGFNESSEIWFRQIVTKAADNDDVKAEVTGVDARGITFIAPVVYGNQTVLLKQDGKEYKLGEMLFADQPEEPADVEILPKKIKRVSLYQNDHWEYSYEYDYDDNGRILSCKLLNYGINKYTYSGNKITIKNDENEYEATFTLENGRIKSYSYAAYESENYTLNYDGNYLNKVNGSHREEDDEFLFTETFSFSGGNMTKYEYDDNDSDYTHIIFTYGSQLNNLNIDLFYFIGESRFEGCISNSFEFDMTGKRSHYLPVSMKISCAEWDDDGEKIIGTESYATELEYEMNGEYITKFTLKNDDGYAESFVIEYE
ncbi:MAG: hypothetical protein K2O69_05325 [Odoribacter sp.]|nr:hypothetical protein [Odoribacter sp.]